MRRNIKQLLATALPTTDSWKVYLLSNWRKIIGPLHGKLTIEKIDGNIVTFGVFDSCWMQELYHLSPLLVRTINKSLEHPYIEQVRFRRARKRASTPTTNTATRHETPAAAAPPTPKEARALDAIQDQELQSVLNAFRARCRQEK